MPEPPARPPLGSGPWTLQDVAGVPTPVLDGPMGSALDRVLDDLRKAEPRKEVMKPGSRGGKWYRDRHGHIRYGERPRGSVDHEATTPGPRHITRGAAIKAERLGEAVAGAAVDWGRDGVTLHVQDAARGDYHTRVRYEDLREVTPAPEAPAIRDRAREGREAEPEVPDFVLPPDAPPPLAEATARQLDAMRRYLARRFPTMRWGIPDRVHDRVPDLAQLQRIIRTVDALDRRYPFVIPLALDAVALDEVTSMRGAYEGPVLEPGLAATTRGWSRGKLTLNRIFVSTDPARVKARADEARAGEAEAFHPPGTNGVEGIVAHEFGHALFLTLLMHRGGLAFAPRTRASGAGEVASLFHAVRNQERTAWARVSTYAGTTEPEAFADAFAGMLLSDPAKVSVEQRATSRRLATFLDWVVQHAKWQYAGGVSILPVADYTDPRADTGEQVAQANTALLEAGQALQRLVGITLPDVPGLTTLAPAKVASLRARSIEEARAARPESAPLRALLEPTLHKSGPRSVPPRPPDDDDDEEGDGDGEDRG